MSLTDNTSCATCCLLACVRSRTVGHHVPAPRYSDFTTLPCHRLAAPLADDVVHIIQQGQHVSHPTPAVVCGIPAFNVLNSLFVPQAAATTTGMWLSGLPKLRKTRQACYSCSIIPRNIFMQPFKEIPLLLQTLYLIRHGEGWHNIGYEQNVDAHLTPRGWAQAAALQQHLAALLPQLGIEVRTGSQLASVTSVTYHMLHVTSDMLQGSMALLFRWRLVER